MNARVLIAVSALAALGFASYGWTRYQALHVPRLPRPAPVGLEPDKHKVTPVMMTEARSRATRPAPTFREVAADGSICDLAEMLRTGPLVLLFIKDGCPCSVSAETYFNTIHAAYRGRVRFLGVIDGDAAVARRWAAENGVPFPILPDPDLSLMHAYGATNSAYVALIDRQGRIEQFWPGYSDAMLRELNAGIARLSGLAEAPIETPDAPDELYSGCPF